MGLAAGRDPRAMALAAGRAWGRLESSARHGKEMGAKKSIDHLMGVLGELGFAPERRKSPGEQQIGLRHCPFSNSPRPELMSSARSTWGSCKESWKVMRHRSPSID